MVEQYVWVIALVSIVLVLSVVSIILVAVSLASSEPVIPRSALKKSTTPRTTVPSAPPPAPVPRPARHPTPRVSARGTATVIRTPTSPKQVRTTPRVRGAKSNKLYMLDREGNKLRLLQDINEPVTDVVYFRDGLLVLLAYGNLVYLTKEGDEVLEYQLPATEPIIQLAPFNGQVVGLCEDGHVYQFTFFNEDNYSWDPVLPTLHDIVYIAGTDAGDILWVQTKDRGIAYDATADVVDRQDYTSDVVRVYGADCNEYIEINRGETTGTVRSSGGSEKIEEVYTGAWRDHEFVRVSYEHTLAGVQRVRTVAGNLYYIIEN
jgi:hypothetical protein